MASINSSFHAAFIWSVADLLRGNYKRSDYGNVVLPFTVLRRLDCVLEGTKPAVLGVRVTQGAGGRTWDGAVKGRIALRKASEGMSMSSNLGWCYRTKRTPKKCVHA